MIDSAEPILRPLFGLLIISLFDAFAKPFLQNAVRKEIDHSYETESERKEAYEAYLKREHRHNLTKSSRVSGYSLLIILAILGSYPALAVKAAWVLVVIYGLMTIFTYVAAPKFIVPKQIDEYPKKFAVLGALFMPLGFVAVISTFYLTFVVFVELFL